MAELKKVLESRALKKALEGARQRGLEMIRVDESLPLVFGFTDDQIEEKKRVERGEVHPRDSYAYRRMFPIFAPFRGVLQEHVVEELDRPLVCTLDDLLTAAHDAFLVPEQEVDNAFDRFVRACIALCDDRRSSKPFLILSGCFGMYEHERDSVAPLTPFPLWNGHSDFGVYITGGLVTSPPIRVKGTLLRPDEIDVYAIVTGGCSDDAFRQFEDEITPVLRSLIAVFSDLWTLENLLGDEDVFLSEAIPLVHDGWLQGDFALIPHCLDAYFRRPTKKKALVERRIQNAIRLLTEAEKHRNHAIGLGLAMSAIEALLGHGMTEISEALSQNVAAVLEPEPAVRPEAIEVVKKLYNLRSRAMHGEVVDQDEDARKRARLIATAVLKAIVERHLFMRRAGFDSESIEELIKELKTVKFGEGQPTGISESPVKRYWRKDRPLSKDAQGG